MSNYDQLQVWEKINATKTVKQLKDVIEEVFGADGIIPGRTEPFSVYQMLFMIDQFEEDWKADRETFRSLPTRNYGIRQQLIYILKNPKR